MAGLLDLDRATECVSILDPGAGSGILSAALVDRIQGLGRVRRIELTCYENDPQIQNTLASNLEWLKAHATVRVDYRILKDNYVTSQAEAYNSSSAAFGNSRKFDFVVGNPPYLKLPKEAPEALSMPDVCHGAPNLYFLFASMSLFNLADNGQLVFIMPRSWTSGAYFRKFRQKFLSGCVLERLHLFVGRGNVFDKEDVLQETLILKARKNADKAGDIVISTSNGNDDFIRAKEFRTGYATVVNGPQEYVYLPMSAEDVNVLEKIGSLPETLTGMGLKMRTGLTVDFRHRDELRDHAENGAVPLLYPHHVRNGKVVFPIGKKGEYLKTRRQSLLQPNANCLLVKRFTSKEESRRLQCGIYLARDFPGFSAISTQNKVNFISGDKGLSEPLLFGLYALFNSSLYDRFYRLLNGSTQVNATEINSMPVPPLEQIEDMGESLLRQKDMSVHACDKLLSSLFQPE